MYQYTFKSVKTVSRSNREVRNALISTEQQQKLSTSTNLTSTDLVSVDLS
jgi:hypothetical protein